MLISDPLFYLTAIPAVILYGISKGGFGGGLGILAVPIMSLVISPVQAAAVLLPILCVMDLFGVYVYRDKWDPVNLKILIPGAMAGIALGTVLFRYLTPDIIRLLVGIIAVLFTLDYLTRRIRKHREIPRPPHVIAGGIASVIAGITSFIAHSGAPPISMYLLPQRMHRTVFVGTTVLLFTIMNYVKLVPYAWLGLLNFQNLAASVLLVPVAIISMLAGIKLHKQVSDELFYNICYVFLFIIGVKLIYDGLSV